MNGNPPSKMNAQKTLSLRWVRTDSRTRKHPFAVLICAVLPLLTGVNLSLAQDRGLGLGVIFGEPTGISGKYWISSRNAIDGGLAWSFRRSGYLHLHGDYLWHFTGVFPEAEGVVLYAGPGGRIGFAGTQSVVGIRMVGGAAYFLPKVPMDVFVEIAPVLDLLPETSGSLNGGIGIRYFFP